MRQVTLMLIRLNRFIAAVFVALILGTCSLLMAQVKVGMFTAEQIGERSGLVVLLSTGMPFQGTVAYYHQSKKLDRTVDFMDGEKHGLVRVYDSDGKEVVRESWRVGERHGLTEEFYPNAKLKKQVRYIRGAMSGEYRMWDEQGNIRLFGAFIDAKKAGVWYAYDASGSVIETVRFKNGILMSDILDDDDIEREHSRRKAKEAR